jgi:hypothetical protein
MSTRATAQLSVLTPILMGVPVAVFLMEHFLREISCGALRDGCLAPFLDPVYWCGTAGGCHQLDLQRMPTIAVQRSKLSIRG